MLKHRIQMIQACQHEKHSNKVSNRSSNYQIKLPISSINSILVLKRLNYALLIVKVLNSSFNDSHINSKTWIWAWTTSNQVVK